MSEIKTHGLSLGAYLVASASLFAAVPAWSQSVEPTPDAAGEVEDSGMIVVTAQKREQDVQDVPISMTVVGGEQLTDLGIQDFTELDRYVPNFYVQTTPGNNAFYIRGIGSTPGNLAFEQTVGLFVDGIYGGQAGGEISLDALVSQRVVIGLVVAPAFLIAMMAWLRWDRLGVAPPTPARALILLWLPLLYIAAILTSVAVSGFPPPATIAFVFVNTLLVGISEELMFRGILFRGALSRMTIWKAIWLSCILFGLIHALNVFLTGDLTAALLQAVAAFMSGVLFIALRIRTGSLYPLIIIHALWDFSLFVGLPASAATAAAPTLSPIAMAAPVLLVLPLFLYALFLMRHVRRDFGALSEVVDRQP